MYDTYSNLLCVQNVANKHTYLQLFQQTYSHVLRMYNMKTTTRERKTNRKCREKYIKTNPHGYSHGIGWYGPKRNNERWVFYVIFVIIIIIVVVVVVAVVATLCCCCCCYCCVFMMTTTMMMMN